MELRALIFFPPPSFSLFSLEKYFFAVFIRLNWCLDSIFFVSYFNDIIMQMESLLLSLSRSLFLPSLYFPPIKFSFQFDTIKFVLFTCRPFWQHH